ncbi:hypothetical protein RUM43_009495 [Polyplax serrata]|uniref:Uncharacterized protein n=1 Tax=Polyplax serrata TaxID=468196 RepID=A0AAN8S2C3_POLSC
MFFIFLLLESEAEEGISDFSEQQLTRESSEPLSSAILFISGVTLRGDLSGREEITAERLTYDQMGFVTELPITDVTQNII